MNSEAREGGATTVQELDSLGCWGEFGLTLRFAGIDFCINGLSRMQAQRLGQLYAGLSASGGGQGERFETLALRAPIPSVDPSRYSRNGIYTPLVRVKGHLLECEGVGFRAALVLEHPLRGYLIADDGALLATPMVFENYLRIAAAYAVLMRDGLLLHSSGIVVDGKAYLFLGRSGAGKTTLSRLALAAGMQILSDDINLVFPAGDGVFAAGAVPFAGELGQACIARQGRFQVDGLYWLEKGAAPASSSLAATVQIAKLFVCSPVVNTDSQQVDRVLAACSKLSLYRPMRTLHFRRDEDFANIYRIVTGNVW